MKLSPVSTCSFHVHAGNGYRGPGAWKRLRKKTFAIHEGPLDLGRILGNLDRQQMRLHQQYETRNFKQGKAAALQKRLESLSLALSPSAGVGQSVAHAAGGEDMPPVGDQIPQQRQQQHRNQQQPVCCADEVLHGVSASGSRCGVALAGNNSGEQQISCPISSVATEQAGALKHGQRGREDFPQQADHSCLLPSTSKGNRPASRTSVHCAPIRTPNAATKMTIDDRCTSEILGARAELRALLKEQKKLGDAMRRRRLEACLGTGTGSESTVRKRRGEPRGDTGRRRMTGNKLARKGGGRGRDPQRAARRGSHAHPLVFMGEADVQRIELDQMRLEDAEASLLAKLEDARRRKQDYATYYRLAGKYGPLREDEFELAAYPGSHYYGKTLDASRVIQTWWWGIWPRVLRRRKAAALKIQSVFRGFLQRRKWHAIIRLRTSWGNTRIVAHGFVVWRDMVVLTRRVKTFAFRFRNRTLTNCFKALLNNATDRKRMREDMLRDRLRRVSDGVRLRIFEAWTKYTETSLAIKRLRYRSTAQPVFRRWWEIASEDRIRSRLQWACASLACRLLRWKARSNYTQCRGSCVKIQATARLYISSTRIKNKVRSSRIHRAEEAVQAVEDVRVRRLLDTEQQRLHRLQAAIDQDTPSTYENSLAFLETSAGKAAVASRLAAAPPFSESEVEAKREIVRLFMRREQAWIRHDFNANWPPPLRCPRADCCDATFVDRGHCLRHAADVHPADAPEVAELSAAMRDTVGLAVLEEFIMALDEPSECKGVLSQAPPHRQDMTGELPAKNNDEGAAVADTNECAVARGTLDMWKAIEEWRAVSASSSGDRYRQLGASILSRFGSGTTASTSVPDDIRVALNGEQSLSVFGKVGAKYHASNKAIKRKLLTGNSHAPARSLPLPSSDDGIGLDVDPSALEEASSRAVIFLGESTIGRAFLRSAPYRNYLDRVHKPMRDAVDKAEADLAAVEVAEWAAEARRLRAAALDSEQEKMINSLADQASSLVLHGTASAGLVAGLIDDQASLLAVVILAERSAFAKVISTVWNEAVNEAAHLTAIEVHEIEPGVATALSEAAYSLTRSRIMDELIDQCAIDLTGPQGELWPDARATAAVADGIGYRVRCEVMCELIDQAVGGLSGSGEAEKLLSDAAAARRIREERGEDGGEEGGAEEGSRGSEMALPGAEGELTLDLRREVVPSYESHQGTTAAEAVETVPSPRSSCSALVLVGQDERANGGEWKESGRGVTTEVEAAVLVQAVLRRKAVFRKMKTFVARNFIRMYDPGEGAFYWYNQTTMESSWEKPAIIDAYFRKPTLAKSLLYLGETLPSGETTRPSTAIGFESSTAR